MKYFVILLSVLSLTGCATGCTHSCVFGIGPGNSTFDAYANHADNQDPCQFKGKGDGYKLPSFCGASTGKVVRVTRTSDNTFIVHRQ